MVRVPWSIIMGTPQDERQDIKKLKFQANNECRFLIGTPATGGYGITLTEANTVSIILMVMI